jgi:transcriptional regulator with XRE-family HTH domain
MISEEALLIQNKMIGVAIRDARMRAEKSIQECAQVLSGTLEMVTLAEEGEIGLTLPQLEVLAHFLHVSVSYLLGEEALPNDAPEEDSLPYDNVMAIRRKIIGVIVRQARLESAQTLDDVAPILGYTPEHLARIELGEEQITLVELRVLAESLGISFETFVAEDIIPLTPAERDARDLRWLAHLPPDVREFILKPINMPYLQVAMNLSRMPAETLRQIASGLLEITY